MNHSSNGYTYDNSHNNHHNYQHQSNKIKSSQKLVQDQNYSNQTFFMMLSSLQSIIQYFNNRSHDFKNKMFKQYDRVNYNSKNLSQLKNQLNIHIFLFKASKTVWINENHGTDWRLPSNFNKQTAVSFVNQAIEFFKKLNQQDLVKMASDILSILDDKLNNLHIDHMNLHVNHSEAHKKECQKQLLANSMNANQNMIQIGESVNHIQNPNQLKARVQYQSFQNVFNGNNSQPNTLNNQNKSNTHKYQQNIQNKHQSMEIEVQNGQNKLIKKNIRYIALKKYDNNIQGELRQKNLQKIKNVFSCQIFNQRDLKNNQSYLKYYYKFIIQVNVDQNNYIKQIMNVQKI